MSSLPVSGSIWLPTGEKLTASGSTTVSSPMLVGVDTSQTGTASVDVANLATHVSLYPGCVGPTRIFASAGKGLPSWTSGTLGAVPASWIPHVSFKDFPTQSAFTAWLTAMPTRWRECWITYHHEPEGDLPAATFKAQWQQLLAWAATHANRGRVKMIPILTWYAQVNKGYHWQDFWPGAGADAFGWDAYPAGKSNWLPPDQLFALPLQACATAGVPLVVPELGVVVPSPPTPSDFQARALWITSSVDYLRTHGCRGVAWWCGTGSQGSFHLDADPAGLAAYRAEMAK